MTNKMVATITAPERWAKRKEERFGVSSVTESLRGRLSS
jgi:hypothetical protein